MNPSTQALVYSILSILIGCYLFALGVRHLCKIYIQMTWLHVRVSNHPDREEITYEFSSLFMSVCAYCPIIGLAMVLIGIKYLPV